jgi:hypothetical protein
MPTMKKSYSTEIALLSKLRNYFKELANDVINMKHNSIKEEKNSETIKLFKESCDYTKEKDVHTLQNIINLLLNNLESLIRKNFELKKIPVFDKDNNNLRKGE